MRKLRLAISLAAIAFFACAPKPPTYYGVSGVVSGAIVQGVTVTLTDGGRLTVSTTTDAAGNYSFSGLPNGLYTVSASYFGYSFSPANLAVTIDGASLTGENFTATGATFGVSGTILGAVLDGVSITLSQNGQTVATTTSTTNGDYAFLTVANGTYTLTPGLSGYSFNPLAIDVTVNGADVTGQDFTATAVTVTLSPPANLVADAGNGQVNLYWTGVASASTYTVYYSTSSGTEASGTVMVGLTATSTTVTGLSNGTTYYFEVNATSSTGQSPFSAEASATPNTPPHLLANSLWRFVVLSAGVSPGWQRGTLSVDGSGNVTFPAAVVGTYGGSTGYADSNGEASPKSGFMSQASPQLIVDSQGNVKDSATSPVFTGTIGLTNSNIIVMSAEASGTQSIAILVRHSPNATFYPGNSNANDGTASDVIDCDICGFPSGSGARKVIFDQVTSGPGTALDSYEEWGFAAGEMGQAPQIMYATKSGGTEALPYLTAYSGEPTPSQKETGFAIDSQGVVTETVQGTGTNPVFLLNNGFMTDDKTLVLGVGLSDDGAYDPTGFSGVGRYALRIYHVTNPNSYASADATGLKESIANLAGTYAFRKLVVGPGTSAVSAWGSFSVSATGVLSFTSYGDSNNDTASPANITLSMYDWGLTGFPLSATQTINDYTGVAGSTAGVDQFWGVLYAQADASLHGKLSYNEDMFVLTRTEPSGLSSITIAVK